MRRAVQALVMVLAAVVAGGMAVAAVARYRASAARVRCAENFRINGLALHSYYDAIDYFPPAGINASDPQPEKRLSWFVELSPYLGIPMGNWFLDYHQSWDSSNNRHLMFEHFRELECPSRPFPAGGDTPVSTPYVGITGLGVDAIGLPDGDPRAGFLGYERRLTRRDLGTRSASILCILETARAEGVWTAAGRPTARGLEANGLPYVGAGGQFGGLHPGGVNALFADGSVRFLTEPVDAAALEAMAVAN